MTDLSNSEDNIFERIRQREALIRSGKLGPAGPQAPPTAAQQAVPPSQVYDQIRQQEQMIRNPQALEKAVPPPQPEDLPPPVTTREFKPEEEQAAYGSPRTRWARTKANAQAKQYENEEDPRYRNVPELGSTPGSTFAQVTGDDKSVGAFDKRGFALLGAYLASKSPDQVAEIALKYLPGSTMDRDNRGRPMITWNDQRYYVDKPGLSDANLMKLAGGIAVSAPFMRMMGLVGTAGRIALGGTAGGVTSVAEDLTAKALGAKTGVSGGDIAKNAAMGTVVGAGTQGLFEGAPAVGRAVGVVPRAAPPPMTQALADEGGRIVERLGLTPGAYTPTQLAFAANMRRQLGEGAQADAAINTAMAGFREAGTGIGLTTGERSGRWADIKQEQSIRGGMKGGATAQDRMQAFERDRDQALRNLGPRMQETGASSELDVGNEVLDRMRAEGLRQRNQYRGAYDDVNMRGLVINPEAVNQLPLATRQANQERILGPLVTPNAVAAQRFVTNEATPVVRGVGGEPVLDAAGRTQRQGGPMFLEQFERIRRSVGAMRPDKQADAEAVDNIRRSMDKWIDDAAQQAQITGDRTELNKLIEARRLYADYSQNFKPQSPNDDVGRMMQKWVRGEVDAEGAFKGIFGGGQRAPANAVPKIDRIAQQGGGEDGVAMQMIRDGKRRRLIYGERSTGDPADQGSKAVATRIRSALSGDDPVAERLFPPGSVDRQQFLQLADQLEAVGMRARGSTPGTSSSGSGEVMRETQGILRDFFTGLSKAPLVGPLAEGARGLTEMAGRGVGSIMRTRPARAALDIVRNPAGRITLPTAEEQLRDLTRDPLGRLKNVVGAGIWNAPDQIYEHELFR